MPKAMFAKNYPPASDARRFSLFYLGFQNEAAYTSQELHFWEAALKARSTSTIDSALLETDLSWFYSNMDMAFFDANQGSWFFSPSFQPRHPLSTEDFYVRMDATKPPVWEAIHSIAKTIGDYLLQRNALISEDHFNQPANYVLFDLQHLFRKLAHSPQGEYVLDQLEKISQYTRKLDLHMEGSDKLFLMDLREQIHESVQPALHLHLHASKLKDHVQNIRQHLNTLGEMRHTLLHFSLTDKLANPHAYWEEFTQFLHDDVPYPKFPILAVAQCLEVHPSMASNRACPHPFFAQGVKEEMQYAYLSALNDLKTLVNYRHLLDQLMMLIQRAGEVITVVQFQQPMQALLSDMQQFITHSEENILRTLAFNTQLHYVYVQKLQDLTLFEKLFTHTAERAQQLLDNQNNLARQPLTPQDIQKTQRATLTQISQTLHYIAQQNTPDSLKHTHSFTRVMLDEWLLEAGLTPHPHAPTLALPMDKEPAYDAQALPVFEIQSPLLATGHTDIGFFSPLNPRVQPVTCPAMHHLLLALPVGALALYGLGKAMKAMCWNRNAPCNGG